MQEVLHTQLLRFTANEEVLDAIPATSVRQALSNVLPKTYTEDQRKIAGQYELPPKPTYYYTVESMDSSGRSDEVKSSIKAYTTR